MITILIVGTSVALFVYWLRCTVVLILGSVPALNAAGKLAEANGLNFLAVRQQLYSLPADENLPMLCEMLQKDFKVVKMLLRHLGAANTGYTSDELVLRLNFQCMRVCFAALRRFRPSHARLALAEMSATLEYFCNALSRRSAFLAQAGRS